MDHVFQNCFAESSACDIRRRKLCPNPRVHVGKGVIVFETAYAVAMGVAPRLVLDRIEKVVQGSEDIAFLEIGNDLSYFVLENATAEMRTIRSGLAGHEIRRDLGPFWITRNCDE